MIRLALTISLFLVLGGCESQFDKCFKTNQAKLIKSLELKVDDLEVMEAFERNIALTGEDEDQYFARIYPKEIADYEEATQKQKDAGCPEYDESNNPIEYEAGTQCFQLVKDLNEKIEAIESAMDQIGLKFIATESATEICNAQGFYE